MQYDVLTSGYVSMDRIIKIASPARIGYTSLVTNSDNTEIQYGGCGVNVAVALCKLGHVAMPIIRVGDDWEKIGFKQFLEESGVPLDATSVLPGETTATCYLLQDNNNDHITIYYPGSMDKKYAAPVSDEFYANAKFGVMTVASRADNEFFLNQCQKYNVPVAFGMKDDFDAFPEDFLKRLLQECDIIFTNEVERAIIEKLFNLNSIEDLFQIGKVKMLVTTLGKDGSICYERTAEGVKEHRVGICKVEKIVDATGTGDAYISGFMHGYLQGLPARECCKLGTTLASFVIQAVGCCSNIPDADTLAEAAKQLA